MFSILIPKLLTKLVTLKTQASYLWLEVPKLAKGKGTVMFSTATFLVVQVFKASQFLTMCKVFHEHHMT